VITDYLNAVRAIATARQPSFCFSTWHDKPARIYYYLIYSTLKAIRSLTHYTLFRWGKRDSPDCDYCGAILQDDEHIFVHCPRFDDFRNEAIARALRRRMEDDPAAGKRAAWERYVPAVIAYPDDKGVLTKYRIGQVTAPPPPLTVTRQPLRSQHGPYNCRSYLEHVHAQSHLSDAATATHEPEAEVEMLGPDEGIGIQGQDWP